MAVITSAAIGVGTAAYGIYQGEQQKKKAKQAMNDYERADLNNVFDNIQLSTVGTDIAREETQRTASTAIDALQQGGSRNLLAGLPRIQSTINSQNQQIQRQLEDQDLRRSYAIAEDDARIRGVNEQRDAQNLQGIGSQYSAGMQQSHTGMMGALSGLGSLGRAVRSTGSTQDNSGNTENSNDFVDRIDPVNSGLDYNQPSLPTYNDVMYQPTMFPYLPIQSNAIDFTVPDYGTPFMNKDLFNKTV